MNYNTALQKTRSIVEKHLNLFSKNTFDILILPGWVGIVEELLNEIKESLNEAEGRFQIFQISEKFGRLKVSYYVENLSNLQRNTIHSLIEKAELASLNTCVICSAPGKRDSSTGWISVRCNEHSGQTELFYDYNMTVFGKHEDEMSRLLNN